MTAVRRERHGAGHPAPEGPYEERTGRRGDLKYHAEMLRTLELVSELRSESRRTLQLGGDFREMGIVLHLVRNHVLGRLTTMSTLAHESGLSYSTAYRTIRAMIDGGLILRRARTATGRSFSLHPSPLLLERWQEFAWTTRRLVTAAATVADAPVSGPPSRRRRPARTGVVPSPSVLARKLQLSRGLRVLFHADPTSMAMGGLRRQFEMILGVGIRHRALSIDRLRNEIVRNGKRQWSAYDLVACDLPWFGDMISRGRLLPLDSLIAGSDLDLDDFLPDAIAGARRGGRIYGLPLLTTAELLFCRTDLFRAAGVSPPRSVDELLGAARRMHAAGREEGRAGIAWNGARGTALGHTFLFFMAAHGRPVVDLPRDGDGFRAGGDGGCRPRPAFDRPEARAAAELLRQLLACSPPGILSMTWIDRARAYQEGRVAMAYGHTTLAHLFELDETSPAWRQTGYLAHPTAPGVKPIVPLGGYSLTIPANVAPERIPAAWTALQAFTSASAAKLFVANGNLASPRFSLARDPEITALSPVIGAVDRLARDGTLRMWPRPPVPGISSLMTIAGEEIHDMLRGRKSIPEALATAQLRAERALREREGGP